MNTLGYVNLMAAFDERCYFAMRSVNYYIQTLGRMELYVL